MCPFANTMSPWISTRTGKCPRTSSINFTDRDGVIHISSTKETEWRTCDMMRSDCVCCWKGRRRVEEWCVVSHLHNIGIVCCSKGRRDQEGLFSLLMRSEPDDGEAVCVH